MNFNLTINGYDPYDSYASMIININVYDDAMVLDTLYPDTCIFITTPNAVYYPSMDYVNHFPTPYSDPDDNYLVFNQNINDTTHFTSGPAPGLISWESI